jgi:hypothetical protein
VCAGFRGDFTVADHIDPDAKLDEMDADLKEFLAMRNEDSSTIKEKGKLKR